MKHKKIKPQHKVEDAIQFLEDMRNMSSHIDEPTIAISLRVPANVLRAVKLKAKFNNQKYQSLIITYIRSGLEK